MKFLLTTILSISLLIPLHAQEAGGSAYGNQFSATGSTFVIQKVSAKDESIEGSPYLTDAYSPITISTEKNKKQLQARYNAFTGDMEILNKENGASYVLNRKITNYDVIFQASKKVYRSYKHRTENGGLNHDFFLVLSDGNISLLKKESIKLSKKVEATTSYDKERPAKYKKERDTYYVKIGEKYPVKMTAKKKDISNLFPSHAKDILNHIKTNKLKVKQEKDLVKLVKFIADLN